MVRLDHGTSLEPPLTLLRTHLQVLASVGTRVKEK
jgi:hypothetical protein